VILIIIRRDKNVSFSTPDSKSHCPRNVVIVSLDFATDKSIRPTRFRANRES